MIKLENVNKYYNKGRQNEIHVIDDISMELPEKGIVAIFGKSGCGKTTLLNVIGGLDKYENGKILIDNNPITKDTDIIRNKYIGYIFQNYNLNNNETCYENIASALKLCGLRDKKEIDQRVNAVLINVGMSKYAKRYPDTLSGGQQQRIAIARALVKNPRIILADEPTGNLDENNTVMIMEILKEISKTHLVLLVTHEESLVDHYCDMIINLSDGKVISIKNNDNRNGINIKNKNDIYLGEYQKESTSNNNILIDYFGEKTNDPINIQIVNDNGKIYIKINSSNAKIIDENSEIKFKEGEFIRYKETSDTKYVIHDLPEMNEVDEKYYGRLFNIKDSIISGFNTYFKSKRRKFQKSLCVLLCLFAIVLVLFSSIFGVAFKRIEEINQQYNQDLFFVRSDYGTYELIKSAIDNGKGSIEDIRHGYNANTFEFTVGNFSSHKYFYEGSVSSNAVTLDFDKLKELNLVIGKKDNLEKNQIVISSGLADYLLDKTTISYIDSYSDLLGLRCNNNITNDSFTIKGIVKEKEKYIYLDPVATAECIISRNYRNRIAIGENYGYNVEDNELIYVAQTQGTSSYIKENDDLLINGKVYKVKKVIKKFNNYLEWLEENYPNFDFKEGYYFNQKIKELYPGVTSSSSNYKEIYDKIYNEYYYDYLDYYNTYFEDYLKDTYIFRGNEIHLWLYMTKGVDSGKYEYMENGGILYTAKKYKEEHGKYPLLTEQLDEIIWINDVEYNASKYYEEYLGTAFHMIKDNFILVNEKEYIDYSKRSGLSDNRFDYYQAVDYMSILSSDPDDTLDYLEEILGHDNLIDGYEKIISPYDIREDYMANRKKEIVSKLIILTVLIIIMSLCMYFIMKSSTMSRIKEIGIYRAIGVTKKNFMFKYIIETIVLTTLTVIVGYIISSLFIFVGYSYSSSLKELLYYPWYLAIGILLLLYCVSVFCGVVPILSLLRKTPSEILTKYDI